jgi:hypothetical protein
MVRWMLTTLVAAVALSGLACSSDEEPTGSVEPAPALEGAYYAESGPVRWTSFKGSDYITWSGEAACNDASKTAPERCAERGTFVLDMAHKTLRLTDAVTGRVSVRTITVKETEPRAIVDSTSPAPANLVDGDRQLVQGQQQVLGSNVVSSFSLTNPSEPLVQEANLRKFLMVCRVIKLVLEPLPMPVIVPPQPVIEAPAPITQQNCPPPT